MSANSRKGPIVDPGECRCCGAVKKCRLLNVEYEWLGQPEVYADMFVDCFGLVLSHMEGEESGRLICATCVVRLRDARAFRLQVLQCEGKLLHANIQVHEEENNQVKMEFDMKEEIVVTPEPPGAPEDADDDVTDPMEHAGQDHNTAETAEIEENNQIKLEFDMKEELVVTPEPPGAPEDSDDDVTVPMEHAGQDHNTAETAEIVSIQVKVEELQEDSKQLSPRRTEGATDDSAKNDMLHKLNRMKEKLNNMQHSDEPRVESPPQRNPVTVDEDLHILHNTVRIVENSFVCPFINVLSDYHCVYCREMFLDPDQLRQHTMTHDPKTYKHVMDSKKLIQVDIVRIDCRLCDHKIDDIDTFKDHITSVHGKSLYTDVNNEFMKFKLKIGTLTCVECGKDVRFFHGLKKHMAVHFGTFKCDVCGARYFEQRHIILHKISHNTNVEMFPCNECDKTFRSKNSRNFHISRIHKNEPAYPCNECDEVFISYYIRYRHYMNVHGEKRMFPCEGCEKVFVSRKTLREHNERTHLQLLRHECNLCDKKFYLPSALRDHMISHTGERKFRCEFCGKNYPRSKALKVHIQSHSTEKKFKCALCPSSYTQVTSYRNHMRTKHPVPEVNEGYR